MGTGKFVPDELLELLLVIVALHALVVPFPDTPVPVANTAVPAPLPVGPAGALPFVNAYGADADALKLELATVELPAANTSSEGNTHVTTLICGTVPCHTCPLPVNDKWTS